MATFILDGWLCPPPHGECQCYGEVFCHSLDNFSQQRGSLLERLCCSTSLFKIPQRCSVGIKSGGILGHNFHCLLLAVWFWSLLCWNILLLQSFWRMAAMLSDSILVYPQAFLVPSINVISPPPFALMQYEQAERENCKSYIGPIFPRCEQSAHYIPSAAYSPCPATAQTKRGAVGHSYICLPFFSCAMKNKKKTSYDIYLFESKQCHCNTLGLFEFIMENECLR